MSDPTDPMPGAVEEGLFSPDPALPGDDPNPERRARALRRARETWRTSTTAMPPLAATDGVPAPERPSLRWVKAVAPVAAEIAVNAVEVRARWAVEEGTEAEAIREERREHDDYAARVANRSEEQESADDGLSETEARIARILAPGRVAQEEGLATLVRGPAGRPSSIEDYARLFAVVPLPEIARTWQRDPTFARLRVAGPNVRMMVGIATLPGDLVIPDAAWGADSAAAAGAEGRLFWCDYTPVAGALAAAAYDGVPKLVFPARAVFVLPPGARSIVPVAIQCAPGGPVFTPADGAAWRLATSVVQVADCNHHELISHLARTHLVMEPIGLATHQQLAPNHPLNTLLTPHLEGTVFINDLARRFLIAAGGTIDRAFAGTITSAQAYAAFGVTGYDFVRDGFRSWLTRSGVAIIPDHPYRDDATRNWRALERWIEAYVGLVYVDDAAVAADVELRAWNAQLRGPVAGGGLPGFPVVRDRAALVGALTEIVFIASVQHAAVNFPQRTDMAYSPAVSGAGWRAAPAGESIDAAARLAFAPPLELAREMADVLNLLGGVHHTALGEYRTNRLLSRSVFDDPRVEVPLAALRAELSAVEAAILADNADPSRRAVPYVHLLPSRIPMSVNI